MEVAWLREIVWSRNIQGTLQACPNVIVHFSSILHPGKYNPVFQAHLLGAEHCGRFPEPFFCLRTVTQQVVKSALEHRAGAGSFHGVVCLALEGCSLGVSFLLSRFKVGTLYFLTLPDVGTL